MGYYDDVLIREVLPLFPKTPFLLLLHTTGNTRGRGVRNDWISNLSCRYENYFGLII